MTVTRSIFRGLGLALGAPGLLLGLWLANLAVALPAAVMLSSTLEASIAPGLAQDTLREGFDTVWYTELESEARGLATTFTPSVIGAAAVFDNLEAWWSGRLFSGFPGLVALALLYALLWAFLLGGVLDRLMEPRRRPGLERFLAAGARTWRRFVQLALLSAVAYYLVYRLLRWLIGQVFAHNREVTSEKAFFLWVVGLVAVTVLLLSLVRLVFDFAKVALATGSEPGTLSATLRGLAIVARHPLRVLTLYGGLGLVWLAVVGLYAWLAPGAGQSTGLSVTLAFLGSQLYLLGRLFVRVGLLGAELELYSSLRRRRGVTLAT